MLILLVFLGKNALVNTIICCIWEIQLVESLLLMYISSSTILLQSPRVNQICSAPDVIAPNTISSYIGPCYEVSLYYQVPHLHLMCCEHDDVIKWIHFPRYWPFMRGPVNSLPIGRWRGALIFYLICSWISGWVNNHKAGDLRRHCAYYDGIVMETADFFH